MYLQKRDNLTQIDMLRHLLHKLLITHQQKPFKMQPLLILLLISIRVRLAVRIFILRLNSIHIIFDIKQAFNTEHPQIFHGFLWHTCTILITYLDNLYQKLVKGLHMLIGAKWVFKTNMLLYKNRMNQLLNT